MEQPFYADRLRSHGIDVLVPDGARTSDARARRHLRRARAAAWSATSRGQAYVDVVRRLVGRGAAGVVLGCTEIELLIGPDDVDVPVFATTALHARAAVDFALS